MVDFYEELAAKAKPKFAAQAKREEEENDKMQEVYKFLDRKHPVRTVWTGMASYESARKCPLTF